MSAHLERSRLLLAQSRPADAEQEAMHALALDPAHVGALTLLALSRSEQGRHEAALAPAQEAVGLAPGEPHVHYVHAVVFHRMDRREDAFRAVNEALRLDPADPDIFALLSSIELSRRNWPGALEAAERALQLNAEHVNAANLRSMALVRLGRKTEAMETVDFALRRAPEDAFSHANQGWNCLHRNEPRQAQEHFREALRLDPGNDYAREGMLEALKARNPVYRGLLAYFLWLGRQSARFQWAFIIAVFFGTRMIRGLAASQPQLNWLWWPLLGLLYAFVYLSWTAQPMFNLLLRFDRFGRHVLSPDQRRGSNWFGAAFALLLVGAVAWLGFGSAIGMLGTVVMAVLSICIAATFSKTGRNRMILAACTAGLACVAVVGSWLALHDNPAAGGLITVFTFGFLGFQFLSNVLETR